MAFQLLYRNTIVFSVCIKYHPLSPRLYCRYLHGKMNIDEHRKKLMAKNLPKASKLSSVKHVLMVGAGKGGVGKSTVAVNLAIGFSHSSNNLKVGLLDCDIFGPSLPRMLNLSNINPDSTSEKLLIPLLNYGISCMSMGFLIPPSQPVVWRGLMVMQAVQQLTRGVEWGNLDILVIDLPPGTGDVPLSLAQTILTDGVLLVSTPQSVSMEDVRRAANMFEKLKIPTLGLVRNMSSFICPACSQTHTIFPQDKFGLTDVNCLADIPFHPDIAISSDNGAPITVTHPESLQASVFFQLAGNLWKKLQSH